MTHVVDPAISERFWSYVIKTATCWLWGGGTIPNGYGSFSYSTDHTITAHRFAWEEQHGPIPPGGRIAQVAACGGKKLCVRPDHHVLRMPQPGGAQHPKVSTHVVRTIRLRCKRGEARAKIAADYGLTPELVAAIYARRAWAHVR